jgi:hypothetical protein
MIIEKEHSAPIIYLQSRNVKNCYVIVILKED